MTPEEIAALKNLYWFRALDRVRQEVILVLALNMDRLNRPMMQAMERSDWIGAAYELCNAQQWNPQVGYERCKELGRALEYGRWG